MSSLPTPHGTPINVALVVLFVVCGVVLLLANRTDVGLSLVNIGVGIVVGGGITTVVAARKGSS